MEENITYLQIASLSQKIVQSPEVRIVMNSQFVTGTLKTTVGLLLMAGIWLSFLPLVADTVATPRGTAQSSSFLEDEGQSDAEIVQRSEQEAREPVFCRNC